MGFNEGGGSGGSGGKWWEVRAVRAICGWWELHGL